LQFASCGFLIACLVHCIWCEPCTWTFPASCLNIEWHRGQLYVDSWTRWTLSRCHLLSIRKPFACQNTIKTVFL
jgi:hypothetical protein